MTAQNAPVLEATAPAPSTEDDAAALLEFLRERDVECPLCRYNLRGLQLPRCPECGRELVLSVGLTEPVMQAWITLAAALLLPAGIGVLFAMMFLSEGFPSGEPLLMFLVVLFMAHVPAAAAAIAYRRRFLRLQPATQWWIAGIAIAIAAVSFFLFWVHAS